LTFSANATDDCEKMSYAKSDGRAGTEISYAPLLALAHSRRDALATTALLVILVATQQPIFQIIEHQQPQGCRNAVESPAACLTRQQSPLNNRAIKVHHIIQSPAGEPATPIGRAPAQLGFRAADT
jgi:hypothetical protein